MNKVLTDILSKPVPSDLTIPKVKVLIQEVAKFDENPRMVYSSSGEKLLKDLDKLGAKSIPQNYRGVLLQHWLELLTEVQETSTELPEYTEQTSTVTQGLNEKIEYSKQRETDILETRENAQREVERARLRTEAIIKEQQKIQEQIEKSKLAQPKLDNAKIYANIIIPEPPFLDEKEQADFDTLRNYAENNKDELIEDLAQEIEAKLSKGKNDIAPEQIKLLARDQAEIIVEKIQSIEVTQEELPKIVQLAILDSVITDTTTIPSVVNTNESLEAVVHSSKILFNEASPELFTEEIIENILGKKFKLRISGPNIEDVKVSLSTVQSENSVPVSLGQINSDATAVQERQNRIIEEAKNITVSEASKYVYSNTSTFVESKIASLPAGSKLKSVYSNPAVRGIMSKYGMANPVEWQAYSKFGTSVLKYYPESAPYWSAFAQITGVSVGIGVASKVVPMTFGGGAIPLARIVAIQPVKWVGVPYTYGIATGSKIAFGAGAKAAGQLAGKAAGTAVGAAAATAAGASGAEVGAAVGAVAGGGTPLSIVFAAIGTAIGAVFGKILEKVNWAKVKKFVGEYVLPVAVGGGLVMFGAPVAGLVAGGLLFGVARGATLASITAGAFGVLGFIGSSIGIAIATPVIITILVIPPLVAFIMLVINNSAYVVPPSLTEFGIGRITSPYIDITKTASPAGPLANSGLPEEITYTVKIKAKKSALTNVKITDTCQVISRDDIPCPTFTIPSAPDSISPTAPYVFTYTANLDAKYKDSVVINTIIVTADTVGQSGATAEMSNSLTIGNPPISCPLPGGTSTKSVYHSYSSNDTGHGSSEYWGTVTPYYALPQSTGCMKPSDCPYYGYAYDVFPNGTTEVFAPTVLGKDVNWNCSYAFPNGGGVAGYTFYCNSSDSQYHLVLTHMNKNTKTGAVKSGEKLGTLFNQSKGNTHLHLEFQLGGKWEKPENYFCK